MAVGLSTLLALVFIIACSVVDADYSITRSRGKAAFTFQRTSKPIAPSSRTYPDIHPLAPSTMTTRGGGPRKSSEKSFDTDEKITKMSSDAISSIRFCYKACFAGFVSDVVQTVMEFDVISQKAITWVEVVDVCDSLNLLVFGLGLRKVAKIFASNYSGESEMTPDKVMELCSTMAALWRNVAVVMVGVSMVLSVSLLDNLPFISDKLAIPSGVAAIALLASFVLVGVARDDTAKVIEQEQGEKTAVKPGYEKARPMGFRAARNMRLCTGSFTLMAAVQLIHWIITPADLVGRLFSVFDFITPGTIAGLLFTLYKSFLRAIVNATGGRSAKLEEYTDLLQAQKGFYRKVGDTVMYAAIFGVLPFAVAPLKPYLVKAVQAVAPSFAGEL